MAKRKPMKRTVKSKASPITPATPGTPYNPNDSGVQTVKNFIDALTNKIPEYVKELRYEAAEEYVKSTDKGKLIPEQPNPGKQIYDRMHSHAMTNIMGDTSSLNQEGVEALETIVDNMLGIDQKEMIAEFTSGESVDIFELGKKYIIPAGKNLVESLLNNKKRRLVDLTNDNVRKYLVGEASNKGINWFDSAKMESDELIRAHINAYIQLSQGRDQEQAIKKGLGY